MCLLERRPGHRGHQIRKSFFWNSHKRNRGRDEDTWKGECEAERHNKARKWKELGTERHSKAMTWRGEFEAERHNKAQTWRAAGDTYGEEGLV